MSPDDPGTENLTVPNVLRSKESLEELERNAPGATRFFLSWLEAEVTEDLYHYGNHPECRLSIAIALWFRLQESGFWNEAVEKTYRNRLFHMKITDEALDAHQTEEFTKKHSAR